MRFRRGKRLNDWAVFYLSECRQYRLDRVCIGGSTFWRPLFFQSGCWKRFSDATHRSRKGAEKVCERHSKRSAQLELFA